MYIDPPPTICICTGSVPEEPLDPIVRYWVTSKPYPMIHSEELTVGVSVNLVESYAPVYKTWPVDDGLKLSVSLISLATKMAVQRATFAEDFQLSATLQSLQIRSAKVKLDPYDGFQLSASLLVLQVLGVVVKYTHQPETLNTTATITNLSFIDNSTNFPTTEAVTFDAGFSKIALNPLSGLPAILDENATFMDECDSTEGWTVANGTLEVTNDWLRLTKTVSGQSGIASKPISFTPTNKDWIAYVRMNGRFCVENYHLA